MVSEKLLQQSGFTNIQDINRNVYQARGCNKCNNGYSGRTGIFELLQITPTISSMILEHTHASVIEKEAAKNNMQTLRQQALEKFLQGITSLEEINRVTM
jgi:type IV pilus assembly protein PilB